MRSFLSDVCGQTAGGAFSLGTPEVFRRAASAWGLIAMGVRPGPACSATGHQEVGVRLVPDLRRSSIDVSAIPRPYGRGYLMAVLRTWAANGLSRNTGSFSSISLRSQILPRLHKAELRKPIACWRIGACYYARACRRRPYRLAAKVIFHVRQAARLTTRISKPLTVSRPLHGLLHLGGPNPTDESVGYYHSSARRLLQQSRPYL
jgi:hypothetical protein